MTGIRLITDATGRKTTAIINLKKHKALWEDIRDVLLSRSRRMKNGFPWRRLTTDLVASGKLRA